MKTYSVRLGKTLYSHEDLQHASEHASDLDPPLRALEAALMYYSYDVLDLEEEELFFDYFDRHGEVYYVGETGLSIKVFIREGSRKGKVLHRTTATITEGKS